MITVSASSDIFPTPTEGNAVIIWINGEKMSYRIKELVSPGVWNLGLILRGAGQTGIVGHPAGATVFIKVGNLMPVGSDTNVWNSATVPALPNTTTMQGPDAYTSILSVPLGGLWYAQTPEAIFLKSQQGISIN